MGGHWGYGMKPNLLRAFVFFVLLGSVHVAIAESRHALLIGNKNYAPQVGALKNPHKDIELIGAALARDGFSVVTKKDLTQVETNRAISEYVDRLSDAGPGAVGFFIILAMVSPGRGTK